MLTAIIVIDIIALLWVIQAMRDWPRANKLILKLHKDSHNLSLNERTTIEQKVRTSQDNLDSLFGFVAVAALFNVAIVLYKILI